MMKAAVVVAAAAVAAAAAAGGVAGQAPPALGPNDVAVAGDSFVGRGYDLAYSSLRPVSVNEAIGTFSKGHIVRAEESSDLQVTPLSAGQLAVTVEEVSTLSELTEQMSGELDIGVNLVKFGFQGSGSVRSFLHEMTSGAFKSYQSESSTATAHVRMLSGALAPEFVADVEELPTSYAGNEQVFQLFIQKYGTHMISSVTLGGRAVFRSFTSREQETALANSAVNVRVGMEILFVASVKANYQSNSTSYSALLAENVQSSAFAFGGQLGLISDYDAWAATVPASPMPINVELQSYSAYIEGEDAALKQDALHQAITAHIKSSLIGDRSVEVVSSPSSVQRVSHPAATGVPSLEVRRPERQRFAATSSTVTSFYVNNWDAPVNYQCGASTPFVVGLVSYHDNDKEDRRWRVRCGALDGGAVDRATAGTLSSTVNTYREFFDWSAPAGEVVVGVRSTHSNSQEDRLFSYYTAPVTNGTLLPANDYSTGYVNAYDGVLDFTCPDGSVLSGVRSSYDRGKEDRRFSFTCSKVVQTGPGLPTTILASDYIPDTNNVPLSLTERPPTFFRDEAVQPILAPPVDFVKRFDSGIYQIYGTPAYSLWEPSCGANYRPLGTLLMNSYTTKPPLADGVCVHDRCAAACDLGTRRALYGNGVGLYDKRPRGSGDATLSAFVVSSNSAPGVAYCLSERCISAPLNHSSVFQQISDYVTTANPFVPDARRPPEESAASTSTGVALASLLLAALAALLL